MPGLSRRLGFSLLHLTTLYTPLFGAVKVVISPGGFESFSSHEAYRQRSGATTFAGRLRFSLGRGGLTRLRALLWCDDLPSPPLSLPILRLPPIVHPALFALKDEPLPALDEVSDLPDAYVLYHGPSERSDIERLLEAWSWAADAIGEHYPLLIAGLSKEGRKRVQRWLEGSELAKSVRSLPEVSPLSLLALYRHCTALFHPARLAPWDATLRSALAVGKPIVSIEHPWTDAIVGEAAYLLPAEDARGLGAAIITVLVVEEVAERLSQAALQRAASWKSETFGVMLWQAYRRAIEAT